MNAPTMNPTKAMRDTMLVAVHDAMGRDRDVFFVSADFGSPVLDKIRSDFPDRFINVGIAEQNLINVSAGLALEGYKVFAYAIAPFITMRCYEQTRVNLALLSEVRPMNVTLIGVGAGYSYVVSGPTHQCYEDLTIMRLLPNMRVLSPADWKIAQTMVVPCLESSGIKYVRLDAQLLPQLYPDGTNPDFSRGFTQFRQGSGVCVVSTGYMTHVAMNAVDSLSAEGAHAGLLDIFDLSGYDADALAATLAQYETVLTMEEGFRARGGLDSLILSLVSERCLPVRVVACGLDNRYRFELGSRESIHEAAGIGAIAVTNRLRSLMLKEP